MQQAVSIAQEAAKQTWDMIEAHRTRNAHKGVIAVYVPGIGPYECSDGWVFGYVGSPAGATWGDLLAWMIEEGKAEDLADEPYKSFCEGLNLRFLSTLTQDPAPIAAQLQRMAHINQVLRRYVTTTAQWALY